MRFRILLLVALLARTTGAQVGDTTGSPKGTIVSGVVHDSIAHKPLAGAVVQLVAENLGSFVRTGVSDRFGHFVLSDVPAGHYKVGFFHPLLDSLGVDAPMREVRVGKGPARVDLAVPSPARLRAAICGSGRALDSSTVLVGIVRNARDAMPASGVTVAGRWLEFTFSDKGMVRRTPRLLATTGENGWFAFCNVPTGGTMALVASRGAESTDVLEVNVPVEGFVRRDLYLGTAQVLMTRDTTSRGGVSLSRPRRIHFGDTQLGGIVVAAVGGRALAGAVVGITDGPQTRANERGEWMITDAPTGTRMLEVRAVGYYPERRAVNIVAGAPPVRVALSTLKAVLDTVRIVAHRLKGPDRSGFDERRRHAAGRFITPEDIARRNLVVTSDLFRLVPGLTLERNATGETPITMRGMVDDFCFPAFYIDGAFVRGLSAEDIDNFLDPREISGIEIYPGAGVPAQFQRAQTGCGSIVIWTK